MPRTESAGRLGFMGENLSRVSANMVAVVEEDDPMVRSALMHFTPARIRSLRA